MLKRSAAIYFGGFLFGLLSSALIITLYPSLYEAFLEFLRRRVETQSAFIENFTLMIIVNNLLAASIASFGGVGVSKFVNIFSPKAAKNKALLYFLPVGILFVNGEVLGLLAALFAEHIPRFLSGIFPHGFFEIPAILLSGAIGLEISEESKNFEENFQTDLNNHAKQSLKKFTIVVLLIIIGAMLESGAL
ncbi:hypothetical protein BMS3Abin16_00748 [archaeon BMS3Abin16]|nr:hypothetical protein BMS3Abin16_00748 [archaeon BMS3Abin16]